MEVHVTRRERFVLVLRVATWRCQRFNKQRIVPPFFEIMKRFYFFALLALCISLFACSKDDSEDSKASGIEDKGPLSHLSEEARKFVGCWDEGWIFYPDGTCCRIDYDGYVVNRKTGEWKYDDVTKLLATTIENYQYTITLVTDNAWSGVSLGGNGAVSYHKYDAGYACELLSKKQWKGKSNIHIAGNTYYSGQGLTFSQICWSLSGWDDEFPKIIEPSVYYEGGYYEGYRSSYRVEVERCINVTDVTFNSNTSLTMKVTIRDEYYWTDGGYGYKTNLSSNQIFYGILHFDDIYSKNSKLTIEGTIDGAKPIKREYTSE